MAKPKHLDTPAGRIIFIRTPKRLSPAQLALAMGSMGDDDPRWQAFNQILDEELATRTLESSNPNATDQQMRSAAGGVEALAGLKARLDQERRKPAVATGGKR